MRTSTDALRSLNRYVAERLGGDWEVRISGEQGEFTAPYAQVAAVGPANYTTTGLIVDVSQPFAVYLYPPVAASMEDAILGAAELQEEALAAFVGGLRPLRVPLWDYDGVPASKPATERYGSDYMRLSDVTVNRVPDASDDRQWVVVVDFRAMWRKASERATALRQGHVVESVRTRVVGENQPQSVKPRHFDVSVSFGRARAVNS